MRDVSNKEEKYRKQRKYITGHIKESNYWSQKWRKNPGQAGNIYQCKSTKVTGAPQTTRRQPSIKEQLKPKFTKSNKRTRDKDNLSPHKLPPKKRMNSDRPTGGVNPTDPKQMELNPDHEELRRQIFAGIKLMLDPIKEDIEQIKLEQHGLKNDTESCTGKQLNCFHFVCWISSSIGLDSSIIRNDVECFVLEVSVDFSVDASCSILCMSYFVSSFQLLGVWQQL